MDRTFVDRPASDSERQTAREVAQAVLDGRTTVLEAARALVSLAHTDAIADVEDRTFIIAIESEIDHLPVGVVRKLGFPNNSKRERCGDCACSRNFTGRASLKRAENAEPMSEMAIYQQLEPIILFGSHCYCDRYRHNWCDQDGKSKHDHERKRCSDEAYADENCPISPRSPTMQNDVEGEKTH